MTENAPYYGSRVFVCEVCRREFTPTADEIEALAELQRQFGLNPDLSSAVCAACQGARRLET